MGKLVRVGMVTSISKLSMTWQCKKFNELTPGALYAILQLRNEVFVVEQNCVFQDADDKDQNCHHLMGWQDDKLLAYARIGPPGLLYEETGVGRVVISPSARGRGLGRELMLLAITEAKRIFGGVIVKLGAQVYLKGFYSSLGFEQTSDIYLEDGIEHMEMTKNIDNS